MKYRGLPGLIDLQLLIPVFILLFFSLVTLFSIDITFFKEQLIFSFFAIIIYFVCSQIDFKTWEHFSVPMYIMSLILFIVVLFLGFESKGAVRWISVFGFSIQFSEILKPVLALSLASFLARKQSTSKKTFFTIIAFLLPVIFFIYKQPDLGNALIYTGVVMITLLVYGFPWQWFVPGGILLGIIIPLIFPFLHHYQKERILTFGTSYNAIQSVIAVGSGAFPGKGLGQGTQSGLRFLPERHTDFIFASLSEELGFIGGFIVIITYAFLFYRLYVLMKDNDDIFAKMFITLTFVLLLIQCFINIGMNIGIVPIVGVTLPFVSSGGSSLLSNAIFLGIVSSLSRYGQRKHVLEIT